MPVTDGNGSHGDGLAAWQQDMTPQLTDDITHNCATVQCEGKEATVSTTPPTSLSQPSVTKKRRREDQDDEDFCSSSNNRLWACPFYKLDPWTYYRCVEKHKLRRYADVRQHLTRCHSLKALKDRHYCERCWAQWETPEMCQAHKALADCPVIPGPESLTDDELGVLSSVPRRHTDEEKWFWVWAQVFQGHEPPSSPYVEDGVNEPIALLRSRAKPSLLSGLPSLLHSLNIHADSEAILPLQEGIERMLFEVSLEQRRYRLRPAVPVVAVSAVTVAAETNSRAPPESHSGRAISTNTVRINTVSSSLVFPVSASVSSVTTQPQPQPHLGCLNSISKNMRPDSSTYNHPDLTVMPSLDGLFSESELDASTFVNIPIEFLSGMDFAGSLEKPSEGFDLDGGLSLGALSG